MQFSPVDNRSTELMAYADLPHLTEPIVEHLHEYPPRLMIAADTGARIPALAIKAA